MHASHDPPNQPVTSTASSSLDDPSEGFNELCQAVGESFALASAGPLFTTKPDVDLHELFRAHLPKDRQQHYNCAACRDFFTRYAGLVTVSTNGVQTPAAWNFDDEMFCPPFFLSAVQAVRERVRTTSITGVFLAREVSLGLAENLDRKRGVRWAHLSVRNAKPFRSSVKTPYEAMAEHRDDYRLVSTILHEYPLATFEETLKLLAGGNLARPEVHADMAQWYVVLHKKIAAAPAKGRTARNIIWHAVAEAPAGYTHVRSGVLGTLLDDVKAGRPFDVLERRWREKMGPLAYRRTQADPTRGNIEQAEKIVEKMGIAASLRRRFARLEEVTPHALWTPYVDPAPAQPTSGGVFGHLKAKDEVQQRAIEQPPTSITWDKFRRTVLPDAKQIEVKVPLRGPYVALITACDPNAPPVLQWDDPERRNPFSWYLRHPVGIASNWNLPSGSYVPVTAVALSPPFWGREEGKSHHAKAVDFLLQGCRDLEVGGGGALFTASLRSELHPVRSVLEAHFKTYEAEEREQASACGLHLQEGAVQPLTVRVHGKMGTMNYTIDRWD